MKIRGFSIIEVLVSLCLFFISLAPLMKYNNESLFINRRYLEIEKSYKNFLCIEKQLRNKDIEILKKSLGKREYTKESLGNDELTKDMYIPYELNEEFKLLTEIEQIDFISGEEKYMYLQLKVVYMDKNKKNISANYVING